MRSHLAKFGLGFTLAELLIALAILGLIAAFTIPKILTAQQSAEANSMVKETAAMAAGAFQQYRHTGLLTGNGTTFGALTPYMNYVRLDTSGTPIDDIYGQGSADCNPATFHYCLRLHNGAALMYFQDNFGGSGSTNGIFFNIDPDGKVTDGTTNGPGKAVQFWLYYNGRLSSAAKIAPNTCSSSLCQSPSNMDPPWFNW